VCRHRLGAAAGDDAEDDPQDVDQSVLATQDHIPQPVGLPVLLAMLRLGGAGGAARGPYRSAQPR
jgi:hypothetical protein